MATAVGDERQIESKIVAWCRDCRYYVLAKEIGQRCIGDGDCQRTLIRRRFWICSTCECSYRQKKQANDHFCQECY